MDSLSDEQETILAAAGVVVVLVISYAGLVLVPHLAIHHADEIIEIEHAGLWRGSFPHKNVAGAAMALCVIIGLFIARARNIVPGACIMAGAAVFLLQTGAKTATGLLPVALLMSVIITGLQSTRLRIALVVGVVLLFNLFTVGSTLLPPVRWILEQVMSDPTFTSRVDVWKFALDRVMERPLVGHGFQAFWGTSAAMYSGYATETWAATAGHAHNSYLDVALMSGIPALALAGYWLVVQPLRDLKAAEQSRNDPVLTMLFLQVWLFGVLHACLESTFLIEDSPIWFTFLFCVFGLRLQATGRLCR